MTPREILVHTVTRYDMQQEARAAASKNGYHNRYALGIMLARIYLIEADVTNGKTWLEATADNFTDQLRDGCLRALRNGKPPLLKGTRLVYEY